MSNDSHELRWYQFDVRTLLVLTLVFVLFVAWIGYRMRQAQENRDKLAAVHRPVAEIEELGGSVLEVCGRSRGNRPLLDELFDDPGNPDDPGFIWWVVHVNLSHTKAGGEDLQRLNALPAFRTLDLQDTKVTDAGLARGGELSELVSLNLSDTNVTDAGLEHLNSLQELRSLYILNTGITSEGVRQLKEALPSCQVFPEYPDRLQRMTPKTP